MTTIVFLRVRQLYLFLERDKMSIKVSKDKTESLKLKYEKVLQAIPDLFFIVDKDGFLRDYYSNKSASTILSYENYIDKNLKDFLPESAVNRIMEDLEKVLQEKKLITDKFKIPQKNNYQYHEMRLLPYENDRVLMIVRDITEQELNRLKQKESDELYKKIFEYSPDPIIIHSEGKIVEGNMEAYKFAKVKDRSEFIGIEILKFVHPDSIETVKNRIQNMRKNMKASGLVEEKFYNMKGEVRNVEVSSVPINYKNKLSFLVIFRDVTERKKSEEQQKKLMEKLSQQTTYLRIIDEASTLLLTTENYKETTEKVIGMLGNVTETNRVYIFENSIDPETDEYLMNRKFEWVYNAKPEIDNPELQNISYDYYFPRWLRELSYDKPIHGLVSGFPKREQKILKKQQIVSILIVPIIVQTRFWGFIGFDDCYKGRRWGKNEISMLSVLANNIGSTIERFRTEEQIKKELQTKQILIKEIHHRVKNNLQVIASVLKMQAEFVQNPSDLVLFRNSQSRVQSMALIHENIYNSSNLASVNFKHYLRTISNHLMIIYATKAANISFEIDVEDIDVDINQAIPCGLIANELISNAIKYSFKNKSNGTISIGFHWVDSHYQLIIADNGIGLPKDISFEKAKSLGLRLVHLLTKQLNGDLKIIRKNGTKFILEFNKKPYYNKLRM